MLPPTAEQKANADEFLGRVEQVFNDPGALDEIRKDVAIANLQETDREFILGTIGQYVADGQMESAPYDDVDDGLPFVGLVPLDD